MAIKKNTKQKSSNNRPKIRPFWVFVALFGLVGGIWLYRSFAAVSSPQIYLTTNNASNVANIPNENGFTYGAAGDKIIACDWDGTNGATVAAYRPSNSSFYISNTNAAGNASVTPFQFGNANSFDQPFCGTWAFGAKPTVGIFRDGTFYLASSNTAGTSSTPVGNIDASPGDIPLACDWNGDGRTDLGYYRPSSATFYLAFDYKGWGLLRSFQFGDANVGDYPVCGNWDGSGLDNANFTYDTVGVYRKSEAKFYLRNNNSAGTAEVITAPQYGDVNSFVPVVGNWTGTAQTFIGAYRPGNNAPSAPTNLKVNSASTNGVSLSWGAANDDKGIKGYSIYRNNVWWFNTETTATSYTDKRDIGAGKSYSYYVVAYDGSGTTGPQSNTVSAKISTNERQGTGESADGFTPGPETASNIQQYINTEFNNPQKFCDYFNGRLEELNTSYKQHIKIFDALWDEDKKEDNKSWRSDAAVLDLKEVDNRDKAVNNPSRIRYVAGRKQLMDLKVENCSDINTTNVYKIKVNVANGIRNTLNRMTFKLLNEALNQ